MCPRYRKLPKNKLPILPNRNDPHYSCNKFIKYNSFVPYFPQHGSIKKLSRHAIQRGICAMRTQNKLAPEKRHYKRTTRRCVLAGFFLTFCFSTHGSTTVCAQSIERLPDTAGQSESTDEVRQLSGPRPRTNTPENARPLFSTTALIQADDSPNKAPTLQAPQKNTPEEAPQGFPPAVLGPSKPVGSRIKVIRIPDLYGQCPGVPADQLLNLCEAISYSGSNNPDIRQAQA